jgi:phosphatidate cytidylyltransferase
MARRAHPMTPVAFVVAAAMIIAAHNGDQNQLVLVFLASFPVLFFAGAMRQDRARVAYSIAVTVFGLAWIAIPFAHAVFLRDLPDHGDELLIDVLVATFLSDTCAYGAGRLFGRIPLAPSLSPNKTVEGAIGGFIGGTMGFWFAGLYQDWLPGLEALAMGAIIALIAPIGDLFESMIKRDLGMKDSGQLFGPHGGVLDRLDAVLFTVVVGYYLSVAFVY